MKISEPPTRPKTLSKVCCGGGGGGGWSKGILEFRFGPNLGLRLEAWAKLNNEKIVIPCLGPTFRFVYIRSTLL